MWVILGIVFVIAFIFMYFLMDTVLSNPTLGDVLHGFISFRKGQIVFVLFWMAVGTTVIAST